MAGVYSIDVHQEFDTLCSSLKGSDLLELQILQIVQLYAHHLHTAESEQHQLMYAEECGEEVTALIEQKMPGYEVDEHELYFYRMRECLELEQLIDECSEAEKEYRRKEWLLEIFNDDVSDDDLSDSEEYDDPSEEVGIDVEEEKESFDSLPTFDIVDEDRVIAAVEAEVIADSTDHRRSTPGPAGPDAKFPAENFLGRPMRTPLALLLPTTTTAGPRNEKMESQFNRHHGARNIAYEGGTAIFAKDLRFSKPTWTAGTIVERTGKVTYRVKCQGQLWTRHANQLRPRKDWNATETLLDLYEIPMPIDMDSDSDITTAIQRTPSSVLRRSTRILKPVRRLQINPSRNTYVSN
ncbi:unnamed protein product [Caenorhabditis bovis]|uniref:Uncharacterized protein n=1 Tax=Caenorhabditis bovis TaxID=2654633 RepID=A0A8S1EE67_9PELO|nr:unnamed protein product [Caenorhabditis bovis]